MDWKDRAAQHDRLRALSRLVSHGGSVNDWGCGYGAFKVYTTDNYTGYDIVPQTLAHGRFILSDKPTEMADYTVASGLFNVKLAKPLHEWRAYVVNSIKVMNQMSRKGFGFNVLSLWCERHEPHLYYASPLDMVAEVAQYSRLVELNHSYSPHDFTILCRKEGACPL